MTRKGEARAVAGTVRIGYFGGTFDPIHLGHLHLLEAARDHFALDTVIVMPTGLPYHKNVSAVTPATYRYMMCEAALAGRRGLELSAIEIRRRGPSYTIETIRELKRSFGTEVSLYLVCGSDILESIHLWYRYRELLQELILAVAIRPGQSRAALEERAQQLRRDAGATVELYDSPMLDVSSTAIRGQLETKPASEIAQLPTAVADYIARHELYRLPNPLLWLRPETLATVQRCEVALFDVLSHARLAHSLDTMFYAMRLARRHGLDVDRAALAGLLHDSARELSLEEMLELLPELAADDARDAGTLHGPAAALLAARAFGVEDPEVASAIRWHTVMRPRASALDKLIFLADKLEPMRRYPAVDELRRLADEDIDVAMLHALRDLAYHFEQTGLELDPSTRAALAEHEVAFSSRERSRE